MAELTDLNGNAVSSRPKALLTLEYDVMSGKLQIGGELQNLDLAINILAQAGRYLENQQRMQLMAAFQAEAQRNQQLLSRVMQ